MMGLDNPIHILFLLVLLLLVFGAKRLPEMGRSLGDGLRGFKESISGETPHRARRAGAHCPRARAGRPRRPVPPATASTVGSRRLVERPRYSAESRQGIRMSLWSRGATPLAPYRSDSLTSFTSDQ